MTMICLEKVSSGYVNNTTLKVKLMKRLFIALAAAVAVSTASAIITDQQLFETSFDDFLADVSNEDSSAITAYETQPSIAAPYPCSGFGTNYLKLDTGDATLWRTNTSEAANVYFDMAIQFTPTAAEDEPDPTGNKIVVFMDADTNIVVISGTNAADHTPVTNRVPAGISAKSWARLTLSAEERNGSLLFNVRVNGNSLGSFYSLLAGTTVTEVGFSGSGALDDFVVRTTDPYYEGQYAARIGPGDDSEKYATYSAALADALATTTVDGGTAITLANDTTVNGSASTPYRIQDADSLLALQNAVLANEAVRSLNFVQTANIDMTGVADFYGIGWFDSSTSFASVPTGVASDGKTAIPFAGTYDGQGYTISNVTIVKHSYAGVFNNVSGTIKNLTVQDIGLSGTCTEWGCAIVGNASNGSLLENLTAVTSSGFNWGSSANHNVAGIVVRPIGAATIRGCVNNAAISSTSKRLGGIASFVGSGSVGTVFDSCTNNAALVSTDGTRGVGGILGCAEGGVKNAATANDTIIRNCADFGSETAQGSGGHAGAIVGSNWNESYTYTDDGGNTFPEASPVCGYIKNPVFGLAYAIDAGIDGGNYLTTVKQADLAAGHTYVLLADVAASETPVFTLAAAGDTIAFDTAGSYTFAGTVAASNPDMMDVSTETVGTVTTYTAAAGTEVATITRSGVTTSYNTLQKALAAAEANDTVNLVGSASGAVTIPASITVQLGARYSLADVTSLAGEGVLAMPWGESPQPTVQLLCQQATWAGTLYIQGVDIASAINLTLLGNENATVRVNNAGCAFTADNAAAHAIKALEIGPNGLDFIGNYQAGTFTFPCALTGTGNLKIAVKDSANGTAHKVAKFTGDVSGFAGSISFDADANCAVYFGDATGNGNCISVAADKSVTVAAGKTWTAPGGFVVNGTLVVNGALAPSTAALYGAGGTITFTSSGTIPVGQYLTGTYNANFDSGNGNYAFDLPINAGATTIINGANGVFCGYPRYNNSAPTVAGVIVLNANWVSSNGYSTATTTFAKLSGTGDLMVEGTDSQYAASKTIPYTITELDNYTGTLGGRVGAFTIGKVNVTDQPTNGARVVKTAVVNGTVSDNVPLWVAGVDTTKTLTYDANGADGAGLYYIESAPTPTVPDVTPSASGTVDCGSAAAAAAAATAINEAKATYIKAPEAASLSGDAAAAYANLFDARADGNNVVVELNAAGTNALETAATNIAAQIVAPANLASILSGTRSISVTGVQPGFFYSVVYAANLTALATAAEGGRAMADANGEVPLPMPETTPGATAGFYRVLVNVQPKETEE